MSLAGRACQAPETRACQARVCLWARACVLDLLLDLIQDLILELILDLIRQPLDVEVAKWAWVGPQSFSSATP